MTITIRHGAQVIEKNYSVAPTVADLKQDRDLKMQLGFGDNVRVLVNGVAMPDFTTLPAGVGTVTIETAANQKAS